jgi:hypothetical protein
MNQDVKTAPNRWLLIVGLVVAGLASAVLAVAMVVKAINMIRSGRGLEVFRNLRMIEDNWIGFLVFVVVTVLALAVGTIFRLKEKREIRALEKRYPDGDHGTSSR